MMMNHTYPVTLESFPTYRVKQTVVRTRAKSSRYLYESAAFEELQKKLREGWTVCACHPIGDELEYILQKVEEVNDGKRTELE